VKGWSLACTGDYERGGLGQCLEGQCRRVLFVFR
jgi:hypothetical protein